jgi:hypothetical protein
MTDNRALAILSAGRQAGLPHLSLGDGNAEVTIVNRGYRVRIADLRPG